MRTAVAIYARISRHRTGEGLGVERQLKDCRAETERRGLRVAEEYVDDDVSACNSKRTRPANRQMLDDIRSGGTTPAIVWLSPIRRPLTLSTCQVTLTAWLDTAEVQSHTLP